MTRIECRQARLRKRALPPRVHSPAILAFPGIRLPFPRREIERIPVPAGLIRSHGRAYPLSMISKAAHLQCFVANHLGIQPETVIAGRKSGLNGSTSDRLASTANCADTPGW